MLESLCYDNACKQQGESRSVREWLIHCTRLRRKSSHLYIDERDGGEKSQADNLEVHDSKARDRQHATLAKLRLA